MTSKVQIVATLGPSSNTKEMIKEIISKQVGVVRLNFSWGTHEQHREYIKIVRESAKELGRRVPIIQDLSGPRIQEARLHKFDKNACGIITDKDLEDLKFGLSENVDYVAMSFIGCAGDILELRARMKEYGKVVPIIAKVEREIALENIDEIIKNADAIMIARGDMGNEVPLEQIPFIEKNIISKCKKAKKPVIVATQMLFSMTNNKIPTRAEVTDVAYAILSGADAVMLSEESASGKYPVEAVEMMEKEIIEAEKHLEKIELNPL